MHRVARQPFLDVLGQLQSSVSGRTRCSQDAMQARSCAATLVRTTCGLSAFFLIVLEREVTSRRSSLECVWCHLRVDPFKAPPTPELGSFSGGLHCRPRDQCHRGLETSCFCRNLWGLDVPLTIGPGHVVRHARDARIERLPRASSP